MNKKVRNILLVLLAAVLLVVVIFWGIYLTRIQTIGSIERLTDYEDGYDVYRMEVKYNYDLDRMINYGVTDDQTMIDAITKESLPLLPIKIKAPKFSCSAFTLTDTDNDVHMGRNYDFKKDTSAMMVFCSPKDGYKSVGFAALDNASANAADANIKNKLSSLTAPFICLDGMN